MRIAIVGGGLGGLITAYYIEKLLTQAPKLTIFESSSRLGGKIRTGSFESVSTLYEAGVAELYNYSMHGEDPLRDLVNALGLKAIPMSGGCVVLGDNILNTMDDMRKTFSATSAKAVDDFYNKCKLLCPALDFFSDDWQVDNNHAWANRTLRELLDEIPDETARRYIEVASRSDIASEPHLTSGISGVKDILMEDARYMSVYSVEGGIERLIEGLQDRIRAKIELETPVISVARTERNSYQLTTRHQHQNATHEFDLVVFALPNYWLARIDWVNTDLRIAMQKHLMHYDRPAHYLRITVLFKEPFWRDKISGSYFMLDAFGGCCVYDESARHSNSTHGILGWLIAGNDALSLSNLSDNDLIKMALDSLPGPLAFGRELYLEGRVHRWVGTINALPGGNPIHDLKTRHSPSAADPHLYVVGDYLFDSTLNGAVDSAEFVAESIEEEFDHNRDGGRGEDGIHERA